MHICFLEAYDSGSHRYFYQGLIKAFQQYSPEIKVTPFSLPGRHWRSRLQSGHIDLAEKLNSAWKVRDISIPDAIVLTSLTDSAAFRGLLLPELCHVPLIQYMHENQMSYPLDKESPVFERDSALRDHIFPGHHLNQCLAVDLMVFNSHFHRHNFFENLEDYLRRHAEKDKIHRLNEVKEKSLVIPIGLTFPEEPLIPFHQRPLRVLWNHRWEYDKNPKEFFSKIEWLIKKTPQLEVALLGQGGESQLDFHHFKEKYSENIPVFGEASKENYFKEIQRCRLLPITSHHDFLGLATLEAMLYGVCPLLPNRLVYPELIPQELHRRLLYDEETFFDKAQILLNDGLTVQEQVLLEKHLEGFRWQLICHQWQKLLEGIKAKNRKVFSR